MICLYASMEVALTNEGSASGKKERMKGRNKSTATAREGSEVESETNKIKMTQTFRYGA